MLNFNHKNSKSKENIQNKNNLINPKNLFKREDNFSLGKSIKLDFDKRDSDINEYKQQNNFKSDLDLKDFSKSSIYKEKKEKNIINHIRTRSSICLNEITKLRNDVNLRNIKEYNVNGDFIGKIKKSKRVFLQFETNQNIKSIDFRVFKKLISIFLWNRAYLKIKGGYEKNKNSI